MNGYRVPVLIQVVILCSFSGRIVVVNGSPLQEENLSSMRGLEGTIHLQKDLNLGLRNPNAAKPVDKNVLNLRGYDWEDYYPFSKILKWMNRMEEKYPELVTLETIGKTYEGASLVVAKVTSSRNFFTPSVWIEGGVHGTEYIAPSTVTYIMNKIVTDDEFSSLLSDVVVYFMPVVNPDGYDYTFQTHASRYWKKNRSVSSSLFGCKGVDLAANWDYKWKGGWPCSDCYPGNEPFSELETTAIRNKIISKGSRMKAYISLRSYGQKWLFPYGSKCEIVNDSDIVFTAFEATDAIGSYRGTRYVAAAQSMEYGGCVPELNHPSSIERNDQNYQNMNDDYSQTLQAGGSLDYMYDVAGINYSYVVKLPDTGNYAYSLPTTEIIPVGEETFLGVEVILNKVAYGSEYPTKNKQ